MDQGCPFGGLSHSASCARPNSCLPSRASILPCVRAPLRPCTRAPVGRCPQAPVRPCAQARTLGLLLSLGCCASRFQRHACPSFHVNAVFRTPFGCWRESAPGSAPATPLLPAPTPRNSPGGQGAIPCREQGSSPFAEPNWAPARWCVKQPCDFSWKENPLCRSDALSPPSRPHPHPRSSGPGAAFCLLPSANQRSLRWPHLCRNFAGTGMGNARSLET